MLVTHGQLAHEFLATLEHVVGPQEVVAAVCVGPDGDMAQRRRDILDAIEGVDRGRGVVVLTDMFGGTPSNLAISIIKRAKVEVIAGVNLPMLIKLVSVRDDASPSPPRWWRRRRRAGATSVSPRRCSTARAGERRAGPAHRRHRRRGPGGVGGAGGAPVRRGLTGGQNRRADRGSSEYITI